MNIKEIRVTPMRLPLKTPYICSQGVEDVFTINLIEMEADDGSIGYGETTTAPDADAQKIVLEKLARSFVGRSAFDFAQCQAEAFKSNFLTFSTNMPRFANQLFCGLEMAALDLQGKLLERPVWDLLGGDVQGKVGYFYFLQGASIKELVEDAKLAVADGHPIIYLKVGVEESQDIETVKAVRNAIGNTRLRLDANEAWDTTTTLRMLEAFAPYNVEYVEQPTPSWSIPALVHVKERSSIAIGADQCVFTLHDVYQACSTRAADMIAIGPREVGGARLMIKAAAIAEAAGLNVCLHSSMTTGITTCFEHHIARAIPNLDDGNQIMWQLLKENIVSSPNLAPSAGVLSLESRPGLGFELDYELIARANVRHKQFLENAH